MNALILANFPIAALIFLAMVGIPLWLTFKRPETAPDYTEARAYLAGAAPAAPVAAAVASNPPVGLASAGRLRTAQQHAAAATAVPGRQHAAAAHSVREHTPARERTGAHPAP